jgi:hypothetical protein
MRTVNQRAVFCGCALAALALFAQRLAWSQAGVEVNHAPGSDLIRITTPQRGTHKLEIDDSDSFYTPVVTTKFSGVSLELHGNDAGLIPGLAYHVRVDGRRLPRELQLPQAAPLDGRANCATLHHTWVVTGRLEAGRASSGLNWAGDHWEIAPHAYLLGEHLYNMALVMGPAMVAARACGDVKTLDEMAQYYIVMLRQTETVGELLKQPAVHADTIYRLKSTDPSARTFSASFGAEAGEGELYNAQWLHPAALLVRMVTAMPERLRTPAMKSFAGLYAEFIVKDQLERFLFEQRMPPLGGIELKGRVASWEAAMWGLKGVEPWDTAMSDIDLWLLASTAEMLGAHANDPQLVKIDDESLARLRAAMASGIRFFQSKRTLYPETRNFQGEVVGSASYFNGDYAAHPDMAFSAVGGAALPAAAERRANPQVSWDISHSWRLPVFLRALYENRKALGSEFPRFADIQPVVNQYVYKVFTGDYARPQFRNYFDGSDGWMRVDYNGAGFGNPPSDFCDMHNPKRLCLIPGAILGWAELAFANVDLARLESSLVDLAFASDPAIQAFRERHFFWGSQYKVNIVDGGDVYGGTLYLVVAENADRASGDHHPLAEVSRQIHQ